MATLCYLGTQLPPLEGGGAPPIFGPYIVAKWLDGSRRNLACGFGLGPGHIVLDGDPAPPKRCTAPSFRPMSIMAKRLDG